MSGSAPNPLESLKQTCSIFDPVTDLALLQQDRLLQVQARYFADATFTPEYLWLKLTAAEVALENALRVYFSVRELLPTSPTFAAESAVLIQAGATVVEEPGYDYEPALFSGNTWGLIDLRHRPLLSVHQINFAYPDAGSNFYTVPPDWVRPDKKYSRISLVPATNTSVVLPFSAYLLSAIGAGTTVPFMIQVRYSAGMPNIRVERPDVVDLIFRMAVLGIIGDNFMPQSGSESIDGLSQSTSFDIEKYWEGVEKKIDALRRQFNGPRLIVC